MVRVEKIKDRVSHYKPLIEQEIGVQLGEIPVRKISAFSAEYLRELHPMRWLTPTLLSFGTSPKSIAVYPESPVRSFVMNEGATDIYVVHELSHALWNELEPIDKYDNEPVDVRRLHRVWVEKVLPFIVLKYVSSGFIQEKRVIFQELYLIQSILFMDY